MPKSARYNRPTCLISRSNDRCSDRNFACHALIFSSGVGPYKNLLIDCIRRNLADLRWHTQGVAEEKRRDCGGRCASAKQARDARISSALAWLAIRRINPADHRSRLAESVRARFNLCSQPLSATDNDMASAAPGQPYWGTTQVYDMHDGYSHLFLPSAGRYCSSFVRVTLVAGRLDSLTPFAKASNGFETSPAFIFSSFSENSCGLDSHCSRTGRVLQSWRQLYDRMERGRDGSLDERFHR